MKHWNYIFLLAIFSCGNQQQKVNKTDTLVPSATAVSAEAGTKNNREICWAGTLNGKTPVFIHYQLDSNLIIGEITYLNTKDKVPITLLGTIEEDKTYRLLEFDSTGNITGVIEGKPAGDFFNGDWVSPKTKKELSLSLSLKDTVISSKNFMADAGEIFGDYHYQYGENGFNGDFEINKVKNKEIEFEIQSLTNVERGPNIAEVEKDTISLTGNSFIYTIPESDSCEFKVSFYKGFVYINYTKGYCEGEFGLNATIDGIFLKTK